MNSRAQMGDRASTSKRAVERARPGLQGALDDLEVSQAEAARAIGISVNAMSALCRGASMPSLAVAVLLARFTGRELGELFDLDDVVARFEAERDKVRQTRKRSRLALRR